MSRVRGAHIPWELREVWTEKRDVSVTHDDTRIEFHGGSHLWESKHLTEHELAQVTDKVVVSLVHDKVASVNVNLCIRLTDKSIQAIANGCPNLNVLNVARIENLSDESNRGDRQ